MCFKAISEDLINKVSSKVFDKSFMLAHKAKTKAFTRRRKMPFESLIFFMLNCVKRSMQLELTEFMNLFSAHNNISKRLSANKE